MLIDGKKLAQSIKEELRGTVKTLVKKGVQPGLAVILVGGNPASQIYVESKIKACQELGIYSQVHKLIEGVSERKVISLIKKLNEDKKIHGILVQLPLPKSICEQRIIEQIDPEKDVDCFHPYNVGLLNLGQPNFLPCTPAGVVEILKRQKITIAGKNCLIIGRSNIVGKPLAALLLGENGTVTVAHSKTRNLVSLSQKADIIIVAAGKIGLLKANMVKPKAVVIDVGINRTANGKVVGDVDFEKVSHVVRAITPVPGGVGPMTIAMLMKNTINAANKMV